MTPIEQNIEAVVDAILEDYRHGRDIDRIEQSGQPDKDAVIDIIREYSHSRKQMIPTTSEMGINYIPSMPVEVRVGGATVFVVDVDRFERL